MGRARSEFDAYLAKPWTNSRNVDFLAYSNKDAHTFWITQIESMSPNMSEFRALGSLRPGDRYHDFYIEDMSVGIRNVVWATNKADLSLAGFWLDLN
jgi:hypothetical protein